jgi:hypothetical protein
MAQRTPVLAILLLALIQFLQIGPGHAATPKPNIELSEESLQTPVSSTPSPEEVQRANQVRLREADPLSKVSTANDYFFRYRRAITLRAGSFHRLNNLPEPGGLISVLYWFPLKDLRGVELGADLVVHDQQESGTIHFASRHVYGNDRFRGFYKFGGGIRIVPDEQLVTFLKLANWQMRLGTGFEYAVLDPVSIRLDVESAVSTQFISLMATLGLAFAF